MSKNIRDLELEIDGLRNRIDNFHAIVCTDNLSVISKRVTRALDHLFLHGNLAKKAKENNKNP